MFFALSKLLAFIITPAIWVILLLAIAVFSQNESRKKKCLRWGFGLLIFFTNGFIFTECMLKWEIPAVQAVPTKKYEAGIVLGGMSTYDEKLDRVQFYRGVDRLLQAVELYRKGIIKKIIFTGGSGLLLHPEMKEGRYLERYLHYFNIPVNDFIVESESRNTRENALFTKEIMDKQQIRGNFLLITSGFHMRRSLGCFKTAGIVADPYSTDRFTSDRIFQFDHMFIPNISALDGWSTLVHEVVGYMTYKLMNYA
jgi:uncharacterized SAM-binding protein YcdF (DUF218 family)